MEDRIFIQSIAKMTYLKLLLIINGPICLIYLLSLFALVTKSVYTASSVKTKILL